MTLRIGDIAPDFKAGTTNGPIQFHDWIGDGWAFFFSHPADFTPACTTEMGRTSQLAERLAARGTNPIGLSTDSVAEHVKWIDEVNDTQNTTLTFPIVADANLSVAKLYDMIHPSEGETAAVRSVFIIASQKKTRLTMTYPMSVERNFDEILRVIGPLQTGDKHKIATPADWTPGQDMIIPPSVSDEEAKNAFAQGFTKQRPYLRKV